jgi:flagellar assembly protein FliH
LSSLIKRRVAGDKDKAGEFIVDCHLGRSAPWADGESLSPEDEAARIVDDARMEAVQVVEDAGRQAEGIRLAAYEEGREAAQSELEESKAALAALEAELQEDAARKVEDFWRSVEPELLRLSVDIARKIVRREIEKNDDFIIDAIKAGVRQLSTRHDLTIRANPSDCEMIRDHKDDLMASFDGISSIEVMEDRRAPQGGWTVESESGSLDGRVDSQLKEVERNLMEAVRDAR